MSRRTSPSGEEAERRPFPSVRILIVDDNESWRHWVQSELGKQTQVQVVGEASDGLEAVRKARDLKPDVILLDIGLPNLNGLEAANRITQMNRNAKIIFLTVQNSPEVVQQALNNGATGYVLKMDAQSELLASIATVLQGQRFVSKRLLRE